MEITTKQAKRLKYLARCYSDSTYTTVHADDGKAKRRDYPLLDVSYIEKTLGGGTKVLSDILVSGNPFTGTFEELERIIECGNPHSIVTTKVDAIADDAQETLPPDPPIVQRLKESETGKNFENMAAAVSELAHPEKKIIVVTGPVCPERHDSGRDYSGLSEEAIAEAFASVVGEDIGTMKPSVEVSVKESLDYIATHEPPPLEVAPLEEQQELPAVENVEEAKKVAEETGTPVITAEQRKGTIHLDSAAEGTMDVTAVINNPQPTPKKPTMADLINLRMRCATIRLAEVYGERPDITINEIMVKYPGAIADFNDFLYKDGVKPYTISLESIRKAYPREYPIATNKDGN